MSKLNEGREITHNMHGRARICNRCHNQNVPTVVRVKSEHLCDTCRLKRIERQRQNRSFEHNKCECGKTIGKTDVKCWDCHDKAIRESELDACETVDELKDFIKQYMTWK
jgi:hypothetical protein